MSRFESGPSHEDRNFKAGEQSLDELLQQRDGGILQRLGRSRLRRMIGETLMVSALASAVPERTSGADLESPENEKAEASADALFFNALNDHNAPDYSGNAPQWDDKLSFKFNGNELDINRRGLALAIDNKIYKEAAPENSAFARYGTIGNIFDGQYNYYVPTSDGNDYTPHSNSFALDVMYDVNMPGTVELLDRSSGTTPAERDELGRILLSDGYAFVPEGALAAQGSVIKHDRVGEHVVGDYLTQEEGNTFMLGRFEDSSELALGLMRDVGWEDLKGRDKENFRSIASWIVRAEMNFSADFVQITDHVLHSDQADKEEHLFESMDSWDNKEIPAVMDRARTNQADFNDAVDAYQKFIDALEGVDDEQKAELKAKADEYRTRIIDWQNEQLGNLFDDKVELEKADGGDNSKDALKWQGYKAKYLDGYTADKS